MHGSDCPREVLLATGVQPRQTRPSVRLWWEAVQPTRERSSSGGADSVPYPGKSASRSSPSSQPCTDPSASGPVSPTPPR